MAPAARDAALQIKRSATQSPVRKRRRGLTALPEGRQTVDPGAGCALGGAWTRLRRRSLVTCAATLMQHTKPAAESPAVVAYRNAAKGIASSHDAGCFVALHWLIRARSPSTSSALMHPSGAALDAADLMIDDEVLHCVMFAQPQ